MVRGVDAFRGAGARPTGSVAHLTPATRSSSAKPKTTRLITPFMVKNAASRRDRSSARTKRCSYTRIPAAAPPRPHSTRRRSPRPSRTAQLGNRDAVQQLGEEDRAGPAEAHHGAVEPFVAIEALVGEGVEDVECGDPGQHRHGDRDEQPPRVAPPPGHRQPAADRRDRQRQPQPEVRPVGEALGIAVADDPSQRQRRAG